MNCFISLVSSYHLYHLIIGAYCTVVVVVAVCFLPLPVSQICALL